jgi:cell division protein FtsB
MSAAGSYHFWNVKDKSAAPADESRPLDRKPARHADRVAAPPPAREEEPSGASPESPPNPVDLSGLSIAGITRRRVGWVAAGLVAVWVVVVFARQVGDATEATNRATQMAADNAALAAEVAALQGEVALIVQPEFVGQQARGHGLGAAREIPFTLDPSVPGPVDGAPGSASVRLGANDDRHTPLESWLSLLFGPGA